MKLFFTLLVLFVVRDNVFTQKNIKPTLKTSYSYTLNFGGGNYYGYDLSVGGGIRIKDQTTILLQVNYLRCARDFKSDNIDAFQMLTTSLSVSYRFLKKKHRFSPVLELDAGLNTWSNADGLYIRKSFLIFDKPDIDRYNFEKNSIIGKTKLLLNINVKSLDINIGGSFNSYFFHVNNTNKPQYGSYYYLEKGIGFEAQVLYTFPMKKQAAKKALE